MTTPDDHNAIAELEIQIAHQAKQLDELNEIVRTQWEEIDKLTRSVTHLAERLVGMESADSKTQAGNEPPPPHY